MAIQLGLCLTWLKTWKSGSFVTRLIIELKLSLCYQGRQDERLYYATYMNSMIGTVVTRAEQDL